MIKIRAFYDVLGSPKEFVVDYLKQLVSKVKEYEGVRVLEEEYLEPSQQGNMWSSVAILTLEFDDLEKLFEFVIDYPPSTIEVLEPEGPEEILKKIEEIVKKLDAEAEAKKELKKQLKELKKALKALRGFVFTRSFLQLFLNDQLAKHHQLGMLIKNLQAENILLKKQVEELNAKIQQSRDDTLKEKTELQQKLDEVTELLEKVTQQLDSCLKEKEQLEKKLEELQKSTNKGG